MNCFQRHLNWIMGSGLLAYFILGFVFLSYHGFTSPTMPERVLPLFCMPVAFLVILVPSYQLGDTVPNLSDVLILFSVLIPVIWAFRQKRRSWGWLLFGFIPFGPVIWLCLENRKEKRLK